MSDAPNFFRPRPLPPSLAQSPISIPEHEVIRRIGHGASGEVWLARNLLGVYRAVNHPLWRAGEAALLREGISRDDAI
ncbi:MAG: hypothetical protein ACLQVY_23740 [Limisphaerales bacterium]